MGFYHGLTICTAAGLGVHGVEALSEMLLTIDVCKTDSSHAQDKADLLSKARPVKQNEL